MAKIIFSFKTGEYREIDLRNSAKISIGRAPDNDIVINRRMASRKHAFIEKRGKGYVLSDAGSFNGTFINRKRVNVHELQHRDVIQIADRVLVFLTKDLDKSPEEDPDLVTTAALEETVPKPKSSTSPRRSSPLPVREQGPKGSAKRAEPVTTIRRPASISVSRPKTSRHSKNNDARAARSPIQLLDSRRDVFLLILLLLFRRASDKPSVPDRRCDRSALGVPERLYGNPDMGRIPESHQ